MVSGDLRKRFARNAADDPALQVDEPPQLGRRKFTFCRSSEGLYTLLSEKGDFDANN